jgi:N-formylglutamate amidohydrolase
MTAPWDGPLNALTDARRDPAPPAPAMSPAEAEAPFVLIEPLHRTAALVFSSPHSGRRYPEGFLAEAHAPLPSLRRSEDAFVDELFAAAAAHGAPVLCATYGRAFVDLNRDPWELDPDMFIDPPPRSRLALTSRVQAGLGAIPRISGDGAPIYRRRIALAEAERRLALAHAPYHAMLGNLISETVESFGAAVLVDCHSMPSSARGPQGPDIVLGDRFGASCHPCVTALAEATLRRQGYRVARNSPFAGGHTVQSYGRPQRGVHALQIEINRALYMNERSLAPSFGFARVKADMTRLVETLASAELHQRLA